MLNFSKIKITAILAFCALAIFYALPSFLFSDHNLGQQIEENQSSKLSLNSFIDSSNTHTLSMLPLNQHSVSPP